MKGTYSLLATTTLCMMPSVLAASTEEAWQAFRQAVADECGGAVAMAYGGSATIEVNPFGSESYGAALVLIEDPSGQRERLVCIYDKRARTVELTAPFAAGAE